MTIRAPRLIATTVTLLTALISCAVSHAQRSEPAPQGTPDVSTVVNHMVAVEIADHENRRPYTVVREYKLKSDKPSDEGSQVVAEINVMPPSRKEYEITNTAGSNRGEKVVRKVLDHETEMAGSWDQTALTPANYDFQLAGREAIDGHDCYVLSVTPKRDAHDLIRGKAWVDAQTYQVRQVTGEPAKSPSWWVKHVNLTLSFAEVSGMWLQVGAVATADVRLFGRHILESRDLTYRTGETVAENASGRSAVRTANTHTGVRTVTRTEQGRRSPVPIYGTGIVLGPR